jgi:hypothetical protein
MVLVQRRLKKKSSLFLRKPRYMNKLKISSRKKEALMHHIHLEIFSSIS